MSLLITKTETKTIGKRRRKSNEYSQMNVQFKEGRRNGVKFFKLGALNEIVSSCRLLLRFHIDSIKNVLPVRIHRFLFETFSMLQK